MLDYGGVKTQLVGAVGNRFNYFHADDRTLHTDAVAVHLAAVALMTWQIAEPAIKAFLKELGKKAADMLGDAVREKIRSVPEPPVSGNQSDADREQAFQKSIDALDALARALRERDHEIQILRVALEHEVRRTLELKHVPPAQSERPAKAFVAVLLHANEGPQ